MQQRDDQPPVSSRPSLLSAEQQAEADRVRLAAAAAATPPVSPDAAPVKRNKAPWVAAGAAAVLCAGAALWLVDDAADTVAGAPVQPVAVNTGAAQPGVVKTAGDPEVSASAILGENPPPVAQGGFSLKDMLSAPASAEKGVRRDPDELSKLLESSPAAPAAVAAAAAAAAASPASPATAAAAPPVTLASSDTAAREDKADADKAESAPEKGEKAEKADKQDKLEKTDKPEASGKSAGGAPVLAKVAARQKKAAEQKAAARVALAKADGVKKTAARTAQKSGQKPAQTAAKASTGAKSAQKPLTREQKAREVKLAAAKKPVARQAKKAPARPEKIDSDVALIAALVSHSQRERAAVARAFKECKARAPARSQDCKATANVKTGPDTPLPN